MPSLYAAIQKRRTIRRFKPKPVAEKDLLQIVDAARWAVSPGNVQPCEFVIVNLPRRVSEVFECVKWNEAVAPLPPPKTGERPPAYIVVLIDLMKKRRGGSTDAAAAAQNAFLAAMELGLGACRIEDLHRKRLKTKLKIPHHLHVDSVIGLGIPSESPVAEECVDSVRPWADRDGVVHVPKRRLADVCTMNGYRFAHRYTRKII
ncbi:MAG: nitroreductase family protein [bacterium]|nr:nitroreductase family protein [bacterium]